MSQPEEEAMKSTCSQETGMKLSVMLIVVVAIASVACNPGPLGPSSVSGPKPPASQNSMVVIWGGVPDAGGTGPGPR